MFTLTVYYVTAHVAKIWLGKTVKKLCINVPVGKAFVRNDKS